MLVAQSFLLSVITDAFESLKTVVLRWLYNRETSDLQGKKKIDLKSQNFCVSTQDEFGLRFCPPVFIQRYMIVKEILEHPIWNGSLKRVVDFGCSDFGMFTCIKRVPGLTNIMLVDIDYDTLYKHQTKVEPTNDDYFSANDFFSKEPLTVDIYRGSIEDIDDRMLGVDAVLCVELLQHLNKHALDAVPCNIFSFIKPKLAVFTTPNVEFNIMFPNFTTEFRNDSPKFEWTRKEFQNWANKIIVEYPEYAVQFDGIGAGPSGTAVLGCCCQIAIFYRKDMKTSPHSPIGFLAYKLLKRVIYPFNKYGINTTERIIYDRLRNFIAEVPLNKDCIVDDKVEIPLNKIMPIVTDCCSSIDELEMLVGKLYHTKKNEHGEWLLIISLSELNSFVQYSLSNHSGVYSLLEDRETDNDNCDDSYECGSSVFTTDTEYFGESKQIKIHKGYSNHIDSFNSVDSNLDLVRTVVDYDKNKIIDIDISSSPNSSIIVDDCKVYEDFVVSRKNSGMHEEDINETRKSLANIVNSQMHNNTDKENSISISLTRNCGKDTANKSQSKIEDFSNSNVNEESKEIDDQLTRIPE